MREKKSKKKKEKFVDDGRVVASMDSEYITGYKSRKSRENRKALREANVTRKERWAIYKAALGAVMPVFCMFIVALVLVLFFLYFFWMH
ncbi:MAG: hypothetical protein E7381_01370 [Clostridiales bacterium]|nr:hypothetical protein [Clostridiales bacterium]